MSETNTVSPLRQRMLEDMTARKLNPHTQRSHISSCKRFAAWLKRSPETATPDEVRRFQLHLIESGASICNRNRIMTGIRFLFRVTLRRHDLAAEVWHIKEPQKLPPVLCPEEIKRVLTLATSLKAQAMSTLAYGCGLRAAASTYARSVRCGQIPIALAASQSPTSRDFVPWRFSAAGRLRTRIRHQSGSRKPAHKRPSHLAIADQRRCGSTVG
jgi:hypothetical protein